MSRVSSPLLDPSRYPPPLAIRGMGFETILAARKARLLELFAELGIPYDVAMLESDPDIRLERLDAWRELLVYAEINDAVRSGMIAYAIGADLEHLAAFYAVGRRTIVPAAIAVPAVMESDDELRRRTLLAPEAFSSAGPRAAYVFHALEADPRVLNVDVWSSKPGSVTVAVQSRDGDGTAPADLVAAVRAHLHRDDIKPLTDMVSVRSVVLVPYAIAVEGFVPPGPDPLAVRGAMLDALAVMAASRRTPARGVPRSAVFDAAHVGPLDKALVASPATDIAMGRGEVAACTGIDVEVSTYAG